MTNDLKEMLSHKAVIDAEFGEQGLWVLFNDAKVKLINVVLMTETDFILFQDCDLKVAQDCPLKFVKSISESIMRRIYG